MIPYAGMRGGLGVSIGGLCSIENDMIPSGHLTEWIYPLKMVIFHGYVSLPEGKCE